ncbi:MAG: helix-turn-helix domain-containing protein [Parcubacteria group bacterium]|jgi:sugar-specific transcriptional regulator TrmB
MDLQKQLKNIGLLNSEIEIYLYLLKEGASSPPKIAKGTGIARTNCYNILQKLEEKDLIVEQKIGERKAYITSDPQSLLRNLDKKRETLNSIIPDLRAMQKLEKNKPIISFYEGWDQVKEIFYKTYEADNGVVKGIASTKELFSLDAKFFENYRKELHKRNLMFQDIVTYASGEKSVAEAKEIMKAMYETKIIPEEYKDAPFDILIWNDYIALIVTSEPIFGTLIKNNILATAFKMIFDILWKNLKNENTGNAPSTNNKILEKEDTDLDY